GNNRVGIKQGAGHGVIFHEEVSILSCINLGIVKLHPAFGSFEPLETELAVEFVRIASDQAPAPQVLQVGMIQDAADQPLAQAMPAKSLKNKYIGDVSISGVVGDDAGDSDLLFPSKYAEAQRILNGTGDHLVRDLSCPIGFGQKTMNYVQVEQGTVGADRESAAMTFLYWRGVNDF